jgi:hypothetical protein
MRISRDLEPRKTKAENRPLGTSAARKVRLLRERRRLSGRAKTNQTFCSRVIASLLSQTPRSFLFAASARSLRAGIHHNPMFSVDTPVWRRDTSVCSCDRSVPSVQNQEAGNSSRPAKNPLAAHSRFSRQGRAAPMLRGFPQNPGLLARLFRRTRFVEGEPTAVRHACRTGARIQRGAQICFLSQRLHY